MYLTGYTFFIICSSRQAPAQPSNPPPHPGQVQRVVVLHFSTKSATNVKKLSLDISSASFEFTDCRINYMSSNLKMVVVYRPPPSIKSLLTVTQFLDEFSPFLEGVIASTGPIIIDLTSHLDGEEDLSASCFQDLEDAFN